MALPDIMTTFIVNLLKASGMDAEYLKSEIVKVVQISQNMQSQANRIESKLDQMISLLTPTQDTPDAPEKSKRHSG